MRGILDRLNVDLPFLTCCTCSLMLNRVGAHNVRDDLRQGPRMLNRVGWGGLITFLRSLRQGPRNLLPLNFISPGPKENISCQSLYYPVNFPVCVVPCPHVPMSPCPLSVKPWRLEPCGWHVVHVPKPPFPHAPMSAPLSPKCQTLKVWEWLMKCGSCAGAPMPPCPQYPRPTVP